MRSDLFSKPHCLHKHLSIPLESLKKTVGIDDIKVDAYLQTNTQGVHLDA